MKFNVCMKTSTADQVAACSFGPFLAPEPRDSLTCGQLTHLVQPVLSTPLPWSGTWSWAAPAQLCHHTHPGSHLPASLHRPSAAPWGAAAPLQQSASNELPFPKANICINKRTPFKNQYCDVHQKVNRPSKAREISGTTKPTL